MDANFKVLDYIYIQFYFLSNFQHVVIVNNEIHSSSCVLHYYECSRNHALSASQLELFFHLVQVKNKSFVGLVLPQKFTAGCPLGDVKSAYNNHSFTQSLSGQFWELDVATSRTAFLDLSTCTSTFHFKFTQLRALCSKDISIEGTVVPGLLLCS